MTNRRADLRVLALRPRSSFRRARFPGTRLISDQSLNRLTTVLMLWIRSGHTQKKKLVFATRSTFFLVPHRHVRRNCARKLHLLLVRSPFLTQTDVYSFTACVEGNACDDIVSAWPDAFYSELVGDSEWLTQSRQ